jgi:DNA-binding transcriptional regulator YbjK
MRTSSRAQLSLFELPVATRREPRPANRAERLAETARHCKALLAELERVVQAPRDRAEELAQLYEAALRSSESANDGERAQGGTRY